MFFLGSQGNVGVSASGDRLFSKGVSGRCGSLFADAFTEDRREPFANDLNHVVSLRGVPTELRGAKRHPPVQLPVQIP